LHRTVKKRRGWKRDTSRKSKGDVPYQKTSGGGRAGKEGCKYNKTDRKSKKQSASKPVTSGKERRKCARRETKNTKNPQKWKKISWHKKKAEGAVGIYYLRIRGGKEKGTWVKGELGKKPRETYWEKNTGNIRQAHTDKKTKKKGAGKKRNKQLTERKPGSGPAPKRKKELLLKSGGKLGNGRCRIIPGARKRWFQKQGGESLTKRPGSKKRETGRSFSGQNLGRTPQNKKGEA